VRVAVCRPVIGAGLLILVSLLVLAGLPARPASAQVVPPVDAATPVPNPGGISPGMVDLVVWTPDGTPLSADAVACVGNVCQPVGGVPSGQKISFADAPQGHVQVTVNASGRYGSASTSTRVVPGRLVTVEIRLQAASVPGGIPTGTDGEGPTADSPVKTPAAGSLVSGVAVSAAEPETEAAVRALPRTGAGTGSWLFPGWVSVMLGAVAIGLCGSVAMQVAGIRTRRPAPGSGPSPR
jgi:hypothetical protein